MKIERAYSWKKTIAQLFLLALPTAVLACYFLFQLNEYYAILKNEWIQQAVYFTAGVVLSIVFYSYRFRFITTTVLLLLIYFVAYKVLGRLVVGEFDAFFASIQFLIFAILFSLGWLAGFGFCRWRLFSVLWCVFLIAAQIVIISKIKDVSAHALISGFLPIIVYAFYIIYTTELIRNINDEETSVTWFITKRVVGFLLLFALVIFGSLYWFNADFKNIEKEWGGSKADYNKNKSNQESLTKTNGDGSMSNQNMMRLSGSLGKDNRLVFVARLDNFFPDGRTPNPLYFTDNYYTKFDTLTQTFETDSLMPMNDLFSPNPSMIPLYFAKVDTTVVQNTHATLARHVVNAEVYKVALSANEYLAPSTAFFCQPIPVPKDYKEQYKSAYRAKMWVSDLNSAYFIYNPAGNRLLEEFQSQRFQALRNAIDYSKVDEKFMKYYTFMPKDEEYNKITELSQKITTDAHTTIDKIIAIRNFFLSKDEFGQPMFKYSDNPGIPGLPSANKLSYFLFENRKGYCAYFAGATLFMLRSLGIPSRIATGFLTEDRSSKNPGWYWFYQKQAHAWTQVYFPGYGWIDFDTTVPDVNTQESPQPDGTPPLGMQQAYFVADGNVQSIDTVSKRMKMTVNNVLFHDQNYSTKTPEPLTADVSLATVAVDTGTGHLSDIKAGMHITAASYAEVLKTLEPSANNNVASVIKKIPNPAPVDEIKIIEKEETKKDKKSEKTTLSEPTDWLKVMRNVLIGVGAFIVLLLALPWLIWLWFNMRAKSPFNKYRASLYYLNQLGYSRTMQGPQAFAEGIDLKFNTGFTAFNNIYQKLKYSKQPLTEQENKLANEFYKPFIQTVRKQIPFKERMSKFLNIYNTIGFFAKKK